MNVAFCYESVLPRRGGCETYIASLARRMAADCHEVHLYAGSWDAAALPATLHYHRVAVGPCPRFLRPWYFGAACRRALAGAGHEVTVGFDKITGVDVLYPQGGVYAAGAEHNLLKYRSPLTRRVLRAVKALDPAHRSFLALERAQYRARPLVVAISDMVRRHLVDCYGLDPRDLPVVPVAVHPERLEARDRAHRREYWREQWGLPAGSPAALFVGMNYRLKGLEPLLHALRLLPGHRPLYLVVAGGRDTAPFERLARRLGLADRVRFLGYCADMRNGYFACDLLVHPTFYDPCSNVVLEALACGLPVITSRHNGASELMRPAEPGAPAGERREGYVLADPHDHAELAGRLQKLLDPARRGECAAEARQTAAGWTFEHHYVRMLAVFAEAAARRRAA